MGNTKFWTFLKAFFGVTLTWMSGPLSVPFTAAALWASSRGQKILWGCLAAASGIFASYRVWRNERLAASREIADKDAQITALSQELESYTSKIDVSVSIEGIPPSQVIHLLTTKKPIKVLRVEYLTTQETCVAGENFSIVGGEIDIPVNHDMLTRLWNEPRPDMRPYDHSGPAKIGVTINVNNQTRQLLLPVQMKDHYAQAMGGTIVFRQINGSRTFIGL